MKGNEFCVCCVCMLVIVSGLKKINLKMTQQELAVLTNCFLFVNWLG